MFQRCQATTWPSTQGSMLFCLHSSPSIFAQLNLLFFNLSTENFSAQMNTKMERCHPARCRTPPTLAPLDRGGVLVKRVADCKEACEKNAPGPPVGGLANMDTPLFGAGDSWALGSSVRAGNRCVTCVCFERHMSNSIKAQQQA